MQRPMVVERREATTVPQCLSIHRDVQYAARTVFDVGMNNGDDSAYYLSKGYRVIAVEANPILVQRACERFQTEITSGQMTIESVGISALAGKALFWINEQKSVFSSLDRDRARRGTMPCHPVEIECVSLDALFKKYGLPYYLKLDVEGAERHCLTCLHSIKLPEYISVEAESFEHLLLLWQVGYRQFKVVDQMRHNSRFPEFANETIGSRLAKRLCDYADRFKNRATKVPFPRGSSGPFGEDTPGDWLTFEEAAYNWLHLHFGHSDRGTLNPKSWYDFHAKARHTSHA
jgi:FkbM family methyltransferase